MFYIVLPSFTYHTNTALCRLATSHSGQSQGAMPFLSGEAPWLPDSRLTCSLFLGPSGRMNQRYQRTPKQGLTPNQKRAIFFPRRIIEGGLVMEVPIFYFHIFHSWRRVADHAMPQGIHGESTSEKITLLLTCQRARTKHFIIRMDENWNYSPKPKWSI